MKRLAVLLLAIAIAAKAEAASDWHAVDGALGRPGTVQAGDVHRYSFPRSDLMVTLDGIPIRPALALSSWLAFRDMRDQAEVMGDLVLTQEEVNPVLSRLLESGLSITALHNHLLRSSPGTMYMHVRGHGDAVQLAIALRRALAASRTPTAPPPANTGTDDLPLDTQGLDRIIRAAGRVAGGTYQFSIPRAEPVTADGVSMPPSLGLATAINFQPTQNGRTVVTGDFVLIGAEVTPVLRELRRHGIEVTALHNHLTGEEPRLFFLHFWGNGEALGQARGLAAALDRMDLVRSR